MLPNDPAPPDAAAPATWQYQQPPVAPVVERRRGSPAVAIAVVLVGLLAGTALFASGFLIGERAALQPGTPASRADVFQPFWDTYQTIQRRYAGGEINDQALVRGAIKGMVDALGDPYSAYLTPEEYQAGLQGLSGEFEGIGANIGTTNAKGETSDCSTFGPDCYLVILSPIEGSPAAKAGLKPGDTVLAVDGSTVDGLTVDGARDKIRGKRGTAVVLTIKRGELEPFDVSITRDVIEQLEVIHEDLADGTIGYIRVTNFSDRAAEAYHTALAADVAAGRKKEILDLRGNPGGYVTAAQHIVSEFISSGPIFWEEDADGKQVETDALGGGGATAGDIKLIVLIDRGSASASEIVAGALQDRGRATIVGETSFGKGTVQQWIELPNTGALKLTIAKWLTPDKHWIHHVGILPDVVVTLPDQVPAGSDPVKDKAVEILSGTGSLERAA